MIAHLASLTLPLLALLGASPAQPEVQADLTWDDQPTQIWITPTETNWAKPLHPTPISTQQLIDTYAPPPRAAWCSDQGQPIFQPTPLECADYDVDLELWMLDFVGVDDPALLPQYSYPPTFCGC